MIVEHAYPPNFDAIDAAFRVRGKPVLYAYGDTIYNPCGATVTDALRVHEEVHGRQQAAYPLGVEGWWNSYIRDEVFRLAQEIEAHRAEYRHSCMGRSRDARRLHLREIAKRLSGRLYGNLITYEQARCALTRGE